MTKEILYDKKLFVQSMKSIYKEYSGVDVDKNKELDVVVKILDGHGGTGVFTCDCKKLVAILQTIFAINPEQPLIIQRKEDGDDGDIRVHVLTLRNKQVILACMKRQQLGGDFRSNVSLGAEAIPVKLTKNQEQIALNTAKISKLPWCAVDIMHLKNKNIDGNEDVVLEINASPGTSGISEVIEHNFINVLLNELQDPDEFLLQDKTAGYLESVVINFGKNSKNFLAKLDTGNSASAPTIEVGDYNIKDNKISFNIDDVKYSFDVKKHINIRAGEELYNRPVICVPELILGQRKLKSVDLAIVKNRDHKTTNCLINRDALASLGYVVHPLETHILTEEIQKVKILN